MIWNAPCEAKYEPLAELPKDTPSDAEQAEIHEAVRDEIEGRSKPYRRRVEVSVDVFRADPAAASELALENEVAVLNADGTVRMLIVRNMGPEEAE